ncbi:MAG: ATP-binding cassette domain-containing protein [Rhodothermaceae bacterium]|nr:ATP-binding cassette domain-containing protein [Rhodothermaceae bacterium]MXZ17269.1 ATP-binding cassette domain-containing protein [Rhodothermaceae bacterium]MXZ57430.1 ATP-binding cassette domain-containing protein [Rhodothermaceae bacterium]MYB90414.1 ATP-binding cassette domain-containing protein [Rhodothermaceae bacterium]MYD68279.1 ATP-binding cassette domain-containing protein [Rhodothermaceae bacterium]
MIEVQNLSKSYGPVEAVRSISFRVDQGEVVGFLGPNGAGKSTTMKVMTGYLPPNEGTVLVDGMDIRKEALPVRERIGYLPESTPLYADMITYDYLEFVAAMRGISAEDRPARIRAMTNACGLHDVLSKRVDALSKGYRQRVGLAQAMIHNPPILILDEPTSGLDPNQIVEIRELIREIGRERTVVLSTHILSEVQASCDRVIIIDNGVLVADGTPEELRSSLSGGEQVSVTLLDNEEEVASVLGSWDPAEVVEHGTDDNGETYFRLNSSSDIRADLFRLAVSHNWTLTGLHREGKNLEDVFRQLTSG